MPISVLTNFKELAIYDGRLKPLPGDRSSKARLHYFTYDRFEAEWETIAGLLSKDAILKGAHERFASAVRTKGWHR